MGVDTQRPFDVIVLAGGGGRRLGGVDKAGIVLDGAPLLDRVLAACRSARQIVVVGPRRPTEVPVTWTYEDPAGSGPLAGIAAGLSTLPPPTAPTVIVLATDLPYLTTDAITRLAHEHDADATLYEDARGRRQPLCAAYDVAALTTALSRFTTLDGVPVHSMLDHLRVRTIPDSVVTSDIDVPDDLARAQATTEAQSR